MADLKVGRMNIVIPKDSPHWRYFNKFPRYYLRKIGVFLCRKGKADNITIQEAIDKRR